MLNFVAIARPERPTLLTFVVTNPAYAKKDPRPCMGLRRFSIYRRCPG